MKNKLLVLAATTFLLLMACSDNTSVVSSTNDLAPSSNSRTVAKSNKIVEPDVTIKYSNSVTIQNAKGGKVNFSYSWTSGPHAGKKFECDLIIQPNTFNENEITFNATFDPEELSVDLDPHGAVFNKPILLTLKFKDIDVKEYKINLENFFQYIDENGCPTNENVKYRKIEINEAEGYAKVFDAELWHFSRYGFTR
ncbi:MAG: hypothetical protein CVV23_03620 [Ignavibacteriae bacterium HGW-Ignavibacteriae-2]|jgi:hypothetical protein|nr:MAG: hypothetical protein CVV23_03620 [Ignavibacteriae bacterium HGW-Ignavibacteriae-2]